MFVFCCAKVSYKVAHGLAQHAKSLSESVIWLETCRPFVEHLVTSDILFLLLNKTVIVHIKKKKKTGRIDDHELCSICLICKPFILILENKDKLVVPSPLYHEVTPLCHNVWSVVFIFVTLKFLFVNNNCPICCNPSPNT